MNFADCRTNEMEFRICTNCKNVQYKIYNRLKNVNVYYQRLLTFVIFYRASALLAMQTAVLARPFLSVRHSVTFRYCVQTNEDTIVRFSASGRTIFLVSEEVKFVWIFAGDHPSEALK